MFVIIYENQVVLGQMKWNKFRFENFLNEEYEIATTLNSTNIDQVVIVNDVCKIMPIQGTQNPEFDSTFEFLNGPFWEFTDSVAISSYRKEPLNIDAAKNTLKSRVNYQRTTNANTKIKYTIGSVEYNFATDKETRNAIQSLIISEVAEVNWKVDSDTWIVLSNNQLKSIYAAIQLHIQETFNWEKDKIAEIDSATILSELADIVIIEQAL